MEIKHKGDFSSSTKNVIEYILQNRGVPANKISSYLFPDESLEPNHWGLDNMREAVKLLSEHKQKNSDILIVFDADNDGYASGSMMYQFLVDDLNVTPEKVDRYIPTKKVHGIPLGYVKENLPDLLIVPDAGSSEFDIHKELHKLGVDILVLDHHSVSTNQYSKNALVVNNQLSEKFPYKGLTGSNIVFLFCKAYIEFYELGDRIDVDKYSNLSAWGMIADRASMLDSSVFYYTSTQLKKIQNPLLKLIVEKSQSLEVGKPLTPKDIGFNVSPLVNSMSREGKEEDIKLVIDAMCGMDYEVYNSRLKIHCSVTEQAVRTMTTTKNRQGKKVKEAMELIEERIKEKQTDKNKVLLVNATGIIEEAGINGLVANKISDKYKRPTLVLQHDAENKVLRGSGRDMNDSPLSSFRQTLLDTELFNYVEGHNSAFGAEISLENAMEVIDVLNEQLEDVEYDNVTHTVDLSYTQQPDAEDILEIANHQHLWGQGLEAPLVHVSHIRMRKDDIKLIGSKGNTWKLDLGAADGIMFGLTDEQMLTLANHDTYEIEIEIVGECSINTFRGQVKPQLIIKDFDVRPVTSDDDNPWQEFDTDVLPF